MKICFLHDSIARLGGLERIWAEKMNYLAEKYKMEVYLITTYQGSHPFAFPISSKIHHIDLGIMHHKIYNHPQPMRFILKHKLERRQKKELNRVIGQISPDIITVTTYEARSFLADLKCKAKVIIESHAAKKFTLTDGIQRNILSRAYQKWHAHKNLHTILTKSDIVVTITNEDSKDWNTPNVVIPNFVNKLTSTHSVSANKTAIFAGRFTYQKGLDRMLEAWKLVVDKRSDWKLKLVGDGELKEQLIKQCKKLGIENNVVFEETTKDIATEYLNSSLFLFTSRFEGFGLVLVEAMQCGVPCVSFDCPYGPSDIIDDGVNGCLVENRNIEKFAEAVIKLIENDGLRKQMGQAAIEKAKQYLPENIMPKWIELYESLLPKN